MQTNQQANEQQIASKGNKIRKSEYRKKMFFFSSFFLSLSKLCENFIVCKMQQDLNFHNDNNNGEEEKNKMLDIG